MRKLRIAQVAPLLESVPPKRYGGTERVVSYLTEELVRQGHDVTLFASGDSVTSARLVSVKNVAIRLDAECKDWLPHHLFMLERIARSGREFDVVHFHIEMLHFSMARRLGPACITTVHGRLDLPDLLPLHGEFRDAPLVSISMSQREPLPFGNWVGNVHHGLPLRLYRPSVRTPDPGYLLFLGRISPEKATDSAIRIAESAGIPLKIAAKVDRVDEAYFRSVVRPLLGGPLVEYLGEVNDREKEALLRDAIALLFPIDWPEPFGLVMIEAMACGTPVLARRRGSVSEIVENGVTGFIFETEEEAAAAVHEVRLLDRGRCRAEFERRFSAVRMARDYARIYRDLLERRSSSRSNHADELADSESSVGSAE